MGLGTVARGAAVCLRVARGYDPVLVATAVAVAVLAGGFAADLGATTAQAVVCWGAIVGFEMTLTVIAVRVVGLLPPGDPGRRFWRALAVAAVTWGTGYAVQMVAALRDPAAAVRQGPVATAALGLGTAVLVVAMLTYPLGLRSTRQRLCFWLDIATVMVAVATFGAFVALPATGSVGQLASGTFGLAAGPVVLLVAVFAAVKLLLGGAAPFGWRTGLLCTASAAIGGFAEAVSSKLIAADRANWVFMLFVLSTPLVLAGARVQQRRLHSRAGDRRAGRGRPYSVLPYLALAATNMLTVWALADRGLGLHAWIALTGAICGTALVVARQLVAFSDNARLLAQLRVSMSERDALAEELRHLAFHDTLTGLANRALFLDRTAAALTRSRRHPATVAVLMADLDGFKPVNDKLGHAAGDAVLRDTAQRLRDCVRETDTVARMGGDEFAILVDEPAPESLAVIAERVVRAVRAPFEYRGQILSVEVSVGVAYSDDGHCQPDALLRDADEAMYTAKVGGKGTFKMMPSATRSDHAGAMITTP